MPGASAGFQITSAGQLGSGVVTTTQILDGTIVGADLGTISVAGKIDGAALTGFANIPSGAGLIPGVNLSMGSVAVKTIEQDISVAGPINVAHGLGRTPVFVQVFGRSTAPGASGGNITEGFYSALSGNVSNFTYNDGAAESGASAIYGVRCNKAGAADGGANRSDWVISADGTNIIFTITKTGTPSGNFDLIIIAG